MGKKKVVKKASRNVASAPSPANVPSAPPPAQKTDPRVAALKEKAQKLMQPKPQSTPSTACGKPEIAVEETPGTPAEMTLTAVDDGEGGVAVVEKSAAKLFVPSAIQKREAVRLRLLAADIEGGKFPTLCELRVYAKEKIVDGPWFSMSESDWKGS